MNKNPFGDELYKKRTSPLPPDLRGEYFRDQTKIVHSQPFRRLKSKTQVFAATDNDHICTRIEHVLHVATIAKSICKGLNQSGNWQLDEELAYAIGLAHDLGHPPFGHEGERALSEKIKPLSFKHEINGYRVVEHLANYGEGLNLTYAVKDGIICHCGEDFKNNKLKPAPTPNELEKITDRTHLPSTYEGCIVRLSDKIAYFGRDLEDAIRNNIITPGDIPFIVQKELGENNGEIINTLVLDLINNSKDKDYIGFSEEKFEIMLELRNFNTKYIYNHPTMVEQKNILQRALLELFDYYKALFDKYGFIDGYHKEEKETAKTFGHYLQAMGHIYKHDTKLATTIITDYIAGMTDTYAIKAIETALNYQVKF
ncbi:MAG: HD domain-containing protein [Elusimicrobiota bacterium]|jgi:dGTPase|nr:HD domain-containing protein [Elusimicrobiota bacterium]